MPRRSRFPDKGLPTDRSRFEECFILFRVAEDYMYAEFVDVLNAIRLARLSRRIVEKITALARSVTYADGIEPTDL